MRVRARARMCVCVCMIVAKGKPHSENCITINANKDYFNNNNKNILSVFYRLALFCVLCMYSFSYSMPKLQIRLTKGAFKKDLDSTPRTDCTPDWDADLDTDKFM